MERAEIGRPLKGLRELRVGAEDPAELERRLLERQDQIEYELGRIPFEDDSHF